MIQIDAAEPAAYKLATRAAFLAEKLAVTVESLDCGDFSWTRPDGCEVRVERKTPEDLIASIADGRWASQVGRLSHIDVPVLLIDGTIIYRDDGTVGYTGQRRRTGREGQKWQITTVDGAVLAGQLAGLYVVHSAAGPAPVARRLVALWRSLGAADHASLWPRPRYRVPAGLGILAALPGVGPKKARALIGKYGSPLAALNAIAAGDEGPDKWRAALIDVGRSTPGPLTGGGTRQE